MADEAKKADDEILVKARERFKACIDGEESERSKRMNDMRFVVLDQWPSQVRNERENDPNGARPCLTVDKLSQYRTQIINDIRKNQPSVKVRPIDGAADVDTAEVFQGIIRHIDNISHADIAYETAAEWAIDTGEGYFRFVTDYVNDKSFDQEIYIKAIPNAFSVYLGPHYEPDGSDAEYGFIFEDVPKERFKREHPKAKEVNADLGEDVPRYWAVNDTIRVAEYFYTDYVSKKLVRVSDGRAMYREDYDKLPDSTPHPDPLMAGAVIPRPEIMTERPVEVETIRWCKLTGAEVMDKRDWAGKYIPIVKVQGNSKQIDGKTITWGIVRPAIDAQRAYNYWLSTIVEKMALAPKTPFVGAEGQFEGHEAKWEKANRENFPYIEYKVIDVNGNPVPPPKRVEPAPTEQAMLQFLPLMEHNIQTAIGMFKASVGESQGDQSGRAIKALQSQSDTATFHYPDNLARSMRHAGRIEVDLIPKIYDARRVARILGDNGESSQAKLDPSQPVAMRKVSDQSGKIVKIYNLGVGEYDVTVTVGPSYATRRMEESEMMSEVLKGAPNMLPMLGDLWFKSIDSPWADEAAKRLKKMLPPQLQEPADGSEPIPPQIQQAMQQVQQGQQMIKMQAEQLAKAHQELGDKSAEVSAAQTKLDADRQLLVADYKRMVAELQVKQLQGGQENQSSTLELLKAFDERQTKLMEAFAQSLAQIEQTRLKGEQSEAKTEAQIEAKEVQNLQQIGVVLGQVVQGQESIVKILNAPKAIQMQYDDKGRLIGGTAKPTIQ